MQMINDVHAIFSNDSNSNLLLLLRLTADLTRKAEDVAVDSNSNLLLLLRLTADLTRNAEDVAAGRCSTPQAAPTDNSRPLQIGVVGELAHVLRDETWMWHLIINGTIIN